VRSGHHALRTFMTHMSTSLPQEPLPADTREMLDHLAGLVHDFLYVGDVSRDDMHAAVDRAFSAMSDSGVPSEQALAHLKALVRRIHSGGALRTLDDEAAHWLMSHLVTWLIASYYGS